jgi:phosphocarrier protein HPr
MKQTKVEVTVGTRAGIHTRPSALIINIAASFVADIWIEKEGCIISAKSIIGIMTLAAEEKQLLTVYASGADADDACRCLAEAISHMGHYEREYNLNTHKGIEMATREIKRKILQKSIDGENIT